MNIVDSTLVHFLGFGHLTQPYVAKFTAVIQILCGSRTTF